MKKEMGVMKLKLITFLSVLFVFFFCISCTQVIEKISEAAVEEKEAEEEKEGEAYKAEEEISKEEEIEFIKEPIEEVELPSPIPNEGCGNVAGRIFWNSQPVNGAKMVLCEKFSVFSGCEGQKFEGTSDEKGVFCIENAPTGEYSLVLQLPGEENYLFAGNFLKGATKIKIEEGKTLPLENIHAFKTDLKLISPFDNEEIEIRNPTLSWEDYGNAEYYLIYLAPEAGDIGKLIDEKTEEITFDVAVDILSCKFTWEIEAFNEYGRKIAESEYFNFFVKVECPSCYLKLITPSDKEKIKYGEKIALSWEEHPLADKYNLSIRNTDTNEYAVEFVKTSDTSYEIIEPIPEGEYYWGVFALDSFGTNLAYDATYFTVTK